MRWRSRELLWGTNYENFWSQLKLWRPAESLIAWNVRNDRARRRFLEAAMEDPAWAHLTWVRLRTPREVAAFLDAVRRPAG